jgi:hypothetical protein
MTAKGNEMGTQLELAVTAAQSPSWVIVARATGHAVQEVFGPRPVLATRSLALAYEVVPILDWLHRINALARTTI